MKNNDSLRDRDFTFLDTYEMMDPEKDWQQIRRHMNTRKKKSLEILWKAAALAIMLLSIGFLAHHLAGRAGQMQWSRAGTEPLELRLPDGTQVVLNRQAELRWPESFGRQKRQVELTGEAWFQVQKEADRPFLILAGERALVEVLGTSFKVNSDSSSRSVSVHVEEGRVALSALAQDRSQPASFQIILHKGEQAMLNDAGLEKLPSPDPNYLSWLTGLLHFDQTPLAKVIATLEAHYGIPILLAPGIPENLSFTSTIEEQSLESVLEEICLVLDLRLVPQAAGFRLEPTK